MINDMFALLDMLTNPNSAKVINYQSSGLRSFNRPHDLTTIVDKDTGEIQSYVISMVYTPFAKEDISVKTKVDRDGPRLIISINKSENSKYATEKFDVDLEKNNLHCQYCGISKKSMYYELPVSDRIVLKDVSVKAEDGILTIILPVDHSADSETVIPIG